MENQKIKIYLLNTKIRILKLKTHKNKIKNNQSIVGMICLLEVKAKRNLSMNYQSEVKTITNFLRIHMMKFLLEGGKRSKILLKKMSINQARRHWKKEQRKRKNKRKIKKRSRQMIKILSKRI